MDVVWQVSETVRNYFVASVLIFVVRIKLQNVTVAITLINKVTAAVSCKIMNDFWTDVSNMQFPLLQSDSEWEDWIGPLMYL